MSRRLRWLLPGILAAGLLAYSVAVLPVGILLTPLQTATAAVADWLDTTFFSGHYEQRFEQSREELTALRRQETELYRLQEENRWLREFLNLRDRRPDFTFTDAAVIATDPTTPHTSFTINVGTLDGIAVGQPVLSEEGLAGVVAQVGVNRATVYTLYHPSVHIGAQLAETGDRGVTENADGTLRVGTLPRNCTARVGEPVVTSGLGGIYPAGLLIGRAGNPVPHPDGITATLTVTPYFLSEETRQVMVITAFSLKSEQIGE